MPWSGNDFSLSGGSQWSNGYFNDSGTCRPVRYLSITNNETNYYDVGFSISKNDYTATIKINKVSLENITLGTGEKITVGITPGLSFLYAGFNVYPDAECSGTRLPNIKPLRVNNGDDGRVFVETNISLDKNNEDFTSRGLYFGIIDIDAAQSFKILNNGNELTKERMIAKNLEDLQDGSALKNRFNSAGHYIYSDYDAVNNKTVVTSNTSNIYVPLSLATQTEGLNMVFGYAGQAASGIAYYVNKIEVRYVSDEFGEITGIDQETVIAGDMVSGSESNPNEGYTFTKWIADVNVELENGTEIPAGDPITSAQLETVVAKQNITFTAIHDLIVVVPDTGVVQNDDSGVVAVNIIAIIAGISVFVCGLYYLIRRFHNLA